MTRGFVITMAAMLALAACGPGGEQGAGAPNGGILSNALVPEPAPPTPDRWLGHWKGPEATYLDVARPAPGGTSVRLTLKDTLDEPGKPFEGRVEGSAIRFTRNGQQVTIRPGAGPETGFKWLADKKDCLILVAGKEGYCRD